MPNGIDEGGDPRQSVKFAYDKIGSHFDQLRPPSWSFVKEWLTDHSSLSCKLLIAGCGGGRHVRLASELGYAVTGLDISEVMIEAASESVSVIESEHEPDWIVSDICEIPRKESTFDNTLAVAILHHLPPKLSKLALSELARVMKTNGRLLLSCWDPEVGQIRKGTNVESGSKEDPDGVGDVWIVPWTLENGDIVDRWYHLPSLEKRVEQWSSLDGLKLERAYTDGQNQIIEFSKV